ncbi:MAG: hypothetical protein IJ146_14260 [Kiritimatiellae bacterium]|nr:hypothetical protein [Kiritimatiellia bacterium]
MKARGGNVLFGSIAATLTALATALTASAAAPELAHRWSFNGTYEDSVGGTTAELIGTAVDFNESNTAVVLSGDGNGKGSLNLGTGMLPTDVPEVTLEIWATQTTVKNWARIFDYGPDNQNYFTMTWCQGTDGGNDRVEIKKANGAVLVYNHTMATYDLGTQCHISVTFSANADGTTNVRWARRNTETGAVESLCYGWVVNWNLGNLASGKFYLGHSQYTADLDANAAYDEVRVWRGLLTDAQLTASALAGPDATLEGSMPGRARWTGAVDDDATNAGNWDPALPDENTLAVFSGDFAAQIPSDSSFTCAGVVFENARLSADCDWRGLSANIEGGTLDLDGRKFYLSQLGGNGTITDGVIPSAYQPVEYIASSGAQWLNTGFTPACSDRIEMKLNFENKDGTQCLWCSRGTSTSAATFTAFMINGDKLRFDRNTNTAGGNVLSPTAGATHTVVADGSTLACTLDGANAGTMAGRGGFVPGSPIVLFASHTAGANLTASTAMGNWASYRFYNLKVYGWDGGLKCDFVPVKRIADGELGVYDRIGGTFAANMTDTPFTAGADAAGEADAEGGELHVEIADGASSVDGGVRISGAVKLFKEGPGSLTVRPPLSNTGVGKFVSGTIDIGSGRFVVDGLGGSGTITSSLSKNLIANSGFEDNGVASGARIAKTPAGWNFSGTIYLQKNSKDFGDSQRNGSTWCFVNSGSSVNQNFKVEHETVYTVSIQVATKNNTKSQWKSNGNVQVDGVTVISWSGQNNLTATRTGTITLKPGIHNIRLACTSNSGAQFDNISVIGREGGSVLEVNVPEGETSENNNVAITGARLQMHKTGKGALVMNRENTGFGVGGRYSGSVSMVVKDGTVKKSTVEGRGSCGAQYSTIKVENGGQFDLAGRTYWDYDYIIEGSGPDGSGALVNNTTVSSPWATSSKRGYLQRIALSGNATIGGTQPWALLFWNYGAESITLNGHTLTIAGTTVYSGNNYFNGSGRVVVADGAAYEAVNNSPTASDCDVEVNGTLAVHDRSLTPMKSLKFGADGKFNNPWDSDPLFVVYEEYAPPTMLSGKAQNVQLGADGHLKTTLGLSHFSDVFDSSSTTFFAGSDVTVDLGERTFEADTKLASWEKVPDATFTAAGVAAEAKEIALAVRADGLWAVCLFPDRPATAKWTGDGDGVSLLDPANWNCWNASGTQLDGVTPGDYTTVIIADGTTTLNVPEGVTPPWGRVQFGDGEPKATQWGRIFYGADRSAVSGTAWYMNTPLRDYVAMGTGDIANLVNAAWQTSWLDWAHLRFDGWFKVTPAQAGAWHIRQKFDDYFAFAIDGEWVLVNPTHTVEAASDCEVAEGWHRFTIICGDTAGGQGPILPLNGVNVPMAISIEGGEEVAFAADSFQLGSGSTVVKLGCDCDWRSLGKIVLESGAAIDLNGHVLKIKKIFCDDYIGARVINTAATTGELQVEVDAGETFTLDGITVKGDVRVVKKGAGTLIPATVESRFSGGLVVDEGTVRCNLSGPKYAIGSMNLLQNWNFDEGSVGNNSGDWSYANGGNGFSLPGWTSSNTGRIGLSKASGTWVAKGRDVGKYALYLQSNKNSADVSQDVVVTAPGTYYYRFIYAARPKFAGATTELRLTHGGTSQTLASVTTTADTYSTCEGTVEIAEAGDYTLQFFQLLSQTDKANTIDEVVFARLDANATSGAVKVNEGATLEMNGKYDFFQNIFILNGGTLQNATGTDASSGTAQMKYMFVTTNSTLNIQNSYGFVGNGYTRSILDLGGYTLTVNLNAGGKLFYLYNTEVRNGVLDVIDGGWLETGNAGVTATNATIKCRAAMRANGAVDVRDYVAYRASSKHNEGTAAFKVYGTFTPATDIFYGCQMQNGSTVDLSGRTTAWHTTTAADGAAKGSTTVTFADNATITVNLYGREGLFALARSADPFVVTWNQEPENLATLKFVPDAKSKKMGFKLVPDTKMVPGEEGQVEKKGLRLVYLGGSVLFIR